MASSHWANAHEAIHRRLGISDDHRPSDESWTYLHERRPGLKRHPRLQSIRQQHSVPRAWLLKMIHGGGKPIFFHQFRSDRRHQKHGEKTREMLRWLHRRCCPGRGVLRASSAHTREAEGDSLFVACAPKTRQRLAAAVAAAMAAAAARTRQFTPSLSYLLWSILGSRVLA